MEQVPTSSSGTGRRGGCIWDGRLVTTRLNNEGICSGIRIACRGFTSGSFNCIQYCYLSARSGNIKPVLWNITSTTATTEATSNKENILSCPSPLRNVLNPNGLTAKIIKATKIEVSIAISLNTLRFSCEAQSAEVELLRAKIKH